MKAVKVNISLSDVCFGGKGNMIFVIADILGKNGQVSDVSAFIVSRASIEQAQELT